MTSNFNFTIFSKRRKILLNQLPENSLIIIPNKSISIKSNDVEYKFKPDSDFYYLTGLEEPDAICVLKKEKRASTYILFVKNRNKEQEIWIGKSIGKEGAKSIFKADESYSISEFNSKLKSLTSKVEYLYSPLGKNKNLDQTITNLLNTLRCDNRAGIKFPNTIRDIRDTIHKMRLIKDKFEINNIQKAAEISKNAHILAMAYARPGINESQLEAIIEYKFRSSGAIGTAYPSIVGSGKNSTILHYTKNNKKIQRNDLILVDAGCEFNYYASDVTRTYPATKKFSSIQKEIYQIVLEAQLKSIEQIKPGKRFLDSYNTAVSILVEGLKELKLLKGSTAKIIKKGEYKKFFMHRLGHWVGLDVHDAGPYIDEKGDSIKLRPGMVLTVEPGIYISNNQEDVPKRYQGIGIRIEDDILVTKDGNKILTKGIPKSVDEIEAMA